MSSRVSVMRGMCLFLRFDYRLGCFPPLNSWRARTRGVGFRGGLVGRYLGGWCERETEEQVWVGGKKRQKGESIVNQKHEKLHWLIIYCGSGNRAFADFVLGSLILHFFCVNFIN